MRVVSDRKAKEATERQMKEKELSKVKITKEDVDLIVSLSCSRDFFLISPSSFTHNPNTGEFQVQILIANKKNKSFCISWPVKAVEQVLQDEVYCNVDNTYKFEHFGHLDVNLTPMLHVVQLTHVSLRPQMNEMEIGRSQAERKLREHKGNVVEALIELTNWELGWLSYSTLSSHLSFCQNLTHIKP